MATLLLILKNLPEILEAWSVIRQAVADEEDREKRAKLKADFNAAFDSSRAAGNTDSLRELISRVRGAGA
jgi:hypothetical protein